MSVDDRIVTPNVRNDDDNNIRPQRLADIIGQESVIERLQIAVAAAKGRRESLDHMLFYGPPGLGKTTLAHVMANEMAVKMRPSAGPSIERAGDLASMLTQLSKGDILFIDEIHRLGRAVEEILYPAMEDFNLDIVTGKGPGAKSIRLTLPRFTLIGATTRLSLLSAPLRTRFVGIYRLDPYEIEAMITIVTRAARVLGITIDPDGAAEIGRRARGTPRIALRLLKSVRDFAQVRAQGHIDKVVACAALNLANVDPLGLDDIDRRVLLAIIDKFDGGPVGLDTIAASINEDSATISDVYEPYLLQIGFIMRTPRGRTATRNAYEHLNISYDRRPPAQPGLFDAMP